MTDGLRARREAALRLPPLADGRRDPVLERPRTHTCESCRTEQSEGLVFYLKHTKKWMCRDRVACFQRQRII